MQRTAMQLFVIMMFIVMIIIAVFAYRGYAAWYEHKQDNLDHYYYDNPSRGN